MIFPNLCSQHEYKSKPAWPRMKKPKVILLLLEDSNVTRGTHCGITLKEEDNLILRIVSSSISIRRLHGGNPFPAHALIPTYLPTYLPIECRGWICNNAASIMCNCEEQETHICSAGYVIPKHRYWKANLLYPYHTYTYTYAYTYTYKHS